MNQESTQEEKPKSVDNQRNLEGITGKLKEKPYPSPSSDLCLFYFLECNCSRCRQNGGKYTSISKENYRT